MTYNKGPLPDSNQGHSSCVACTVTVQLLSHSKTIELKLDCIVMHSDKVLQQPVKFACFKFAFLMSIKKKVVIVAAIKKDLFNFSFKEHKYNLLCSCLACEITTDALAGLYLFNMTKKREKLARTSYSCSQHQSHPQQHRLINCSGRTINQSQGSRMT